MSDRTAVRWPVAALAVITLMCGCETSRWRIPLSRTEPSPPPAHAAASDLQFAMTRTLERQGKFEEASSIYRRLIEQDPAMVAALHRLAILCDRQANFEDSTELFRRAVELDPNSAPILCDFGYSLYLQRRWSEAEEILQQAIDLDNDNSRAHNHLGLLYAQTDRAEEALREFAQAGCSPAETRLNLAFVLAANERYAEAQEQCRLIGEFAAVSPEIRTRLQEFTDRIPASGSDSVQLTSGETAAVGRGAWKPTARNR